MPNSHGDKDLASTLVHEASQIASGLGSAPNTIALLVAAEPAAAASALSGHRDLLASAGIDPSLDKPQLSEEVVEHAMRLGRVLADQPEVLAQLIASEPNAVATAVTNALRHVRTLVDADDATVARNPELLVRLLAAESSGR